MTQRAQSVLRRALELPSNERADVAAELLTSLEATHLEDASAVRAAWATEIERRARRVIRNGPSGDAWEKIRERTARNLTKK